MKKEQWEKPELVVLLRNHPEETLTAEGCKSPQTTMGYNNQWNTSCAEEAGPEGTSCHDSSGGS